MDSQIMPDTDIQILESILARKNPCASILQATDATQDKVAIVINTGRRLTYRELRSEVVSFALNLMKHGLGPTSCLAIDSRESLSAVVAILAVGLVGGSWVRAVPALWTNRKVKVTHLLSARAPPESLLSQIQWIELTDDMSRVPQGYVESHYSCLMGNRQDSDIWLFAQTSGTTGHPKFIGLSYENYVLRNDKANLTHDFNPIITACLFPALSTPWVSYNLRTLAQQGTWVLGSDIKLFSGQNVQKVFGSPFQFDAFLSDNAHIPAQRLPIAHVAGAKPSKALTERILERFDVIHNFYGSVEVGGVARNVINSINGDRQCVGRILAGNEVKIVDENYAPLAVGAEGLVGVRNSIMAPGYLGESEATDQCFREGWFYSGDRGYFNEAGELYLAGRNSDIVNIGGVKVTLSHFDEMLVSLPGIAEGLCFMMPDGSGDEYPMALISLSGTVSRDETIAILRKTVHTYPEPFRIRAIYLVESIPKSDNGKPARKDAFNAIAGGQPVWLTPVIFNGKEYDYYLLSAKAKINFQMFQNVDRYIEHLTAELAIAKTARNAYAQALKSLLPARQEQVLANGDTLNLG